MASLLDPLTHSPTVARQQWQMFDTSSESRITHIWPDVSSLLSWRNISAIEAGVILSQAKAKSFASVVAKRPHGLVGTNDFYLKDRVALAHVKPKDPYILLEDRSTTCAVHQEQLENVA